MSLAVHVVGPVKNGLARTLEQALGEGAGVRCWTSIPPVSAIRDHDLLVIDLVGCSDKPNPERLERLLGRTNLWLLVGDETVHPGWLLLSQQSSPPVRVLCCGREDRLAGFRSLVPAIVERVRGPSADLLADLILRDEPCLRPFEIFVRTICRDPWSIRRPAKLARAAGVPFRWLKRECGVFGFERVEHLMTVVRMIGSELLVRESKIGYSQARQRLGITDWSNAHRQLARARAGSRRAFKKLRILMAVSAVWIMISVAIA